MIYQPPKPSHDKSPIWVWLDYLVKWATSERVYIKGWNFEQKASGKYFIPPNVVAGGGRWPWMYPTHIEGDSSQSYSAGYSMYMSALNPLVTTGMTDLVSGANATSCQGVWLAMQNIPAAASSKWNVPQFPYPTNPGTVAPTGTPLKGDLDNAGLYWYYLGDITS